MRSAKPAAAAIPTRGVKRAALQFLQHYWVNSGIAVGLMLLLGLTNGYTVVWNIFGSANQLLAALALWVGTIWLMSKGRQYWFAVVPAVFMFVTSMTMLVWLLVNEVHPRLAGGQDRHGRTADRGCHRAFDDRGRPRCDRQEVAGEREPWRRSAVRPRRCSRKGQGATTGAASKLVAAEALGYSSGLGPRRRGSARA